MNPSDNSPPDHNAGAAKNVYVPHALRLMAAWCWRGILVVIAAALLIKGLGAVTIVVLPVLVSLLIAALLSPVVDALERRRWRRGLATATVFVGAIIVVAGLFALAGQQIATGFVDLSDQAVAGFKSLIQSLKSGPFGISNAQLTDWLDKSLAKGKEAIEKNSQQILGGVLNVTGSLGRIVTAILITLFATFFFLLDGRKIVRWLLRMLPQQARGRAYSATVSGWQALVQYVRVQILVAFVDGAGIAIGAAILGVPLVVPIGILVFLGAFIPIVGAILTGIVAVLIAFLANGWVIALIMLGVVILVQQAESNVLQPFLMGGKLAIHPLGIVLAVTAGSFLLGIAGALFAVPFVAVANSVIPALAGRTQHR
jgi:predicted PurR-regulated permease PerM